MATANTNLSVYNKDSIPDASQMRIGIVVSEWNYEITGNLLKGAQQALLANGVAEDNIVIEHVPGSYELPQGAQFLIEYARVDGVVTLGSVIQGETKHFDFVCQAVAQGVKDIGLKYNKPVIFGVLTDDTMQQAIDRSGGKHGNKGIECAIAAIKMVGLQKELKAGKNSSSSPIGFS